MILETLIFTVHIVLSIFLVLLVLIQRPSGGGALGMGSGFSSQSSSSKSFVLLTAGAGFLLFATSLGMAFLEKDRIGDLDDLFSNETSVEKMEEVEVPTS